MWEEVGREILKGLVEKEKKKKQLDNSDSGQNPRIKHCWMQRSDNNYWGPCRNVYRNYTFDGMIACIIGHVSQIHSHVPSGWIVRSAIVCGHQKDIWDGYKHKGRESKGRFGPTCSLCICLPLCLSSLSEEYTFAWIFLL